MCKLNLTMILGLLLMVAACQSNDDSSMEPEAPVAEETALDGWEALGADQWRLYNGEGLPEAWVEESDGALHFTGEGEGGDIVTLQQYDNFELELEWKISPGGNSGIMFRVSEAHDYPWRTGPEYQILDNDEHPDALEGEDRHAGANYDMHGPSVSVTSPVGEWNQTRIVVNGAHVEHWLNGHQIVAYQLWNEDWEALIAESKWIDMPDYGRETTGHICLQDHSDPVWFRNIRIRTLEVADA